VIESELAAAGFDLWHPFDASSASHEPGLELLGDPRRGLGILVGNTRALWQPFLGALRADPELAASPHPLDQYTERVIERLSATLPGARSWFGHRQYDGRFLPLQRLAAATGLGALAPNHLVIHPVYGPWFALRAVIVCQGDAPTTRVRPRTCACDAACEAAFSVALSAGGPDAWRTWLAVRDACPVGRAYRYSDDQIRYHYALDRSVLP
jgi:methylmalonic aciduria homocystinuria type C protein